jgi:hypothetical protein
MEENFVAFSASDCFITAGISLSSAAGPLKQPFGGISVLVLPSGYVLLCIAETSLPSHVSSTNNKVAPHPVFKAHREMSPFEEATTLCTGITAAALAIPMEHNAATTNQISRVSRGM